MDLVEFEGEGLYSTSLVDLVEFAGLACYTTSMIVLVEFELAALEYYAVADGHDIPASFLTALDPQPKVSGLLVTRRSHSPNRRLQDDALYAYLEYELLETVEDYQAALNQLGILTALTNEITITLQDKTLTWRRWNATVHQPRFGEDVGYDFWPSGIKIPVINLELSA